MVYRPWVILIGLGIDLMAFAVHLLSGLKLQSGPPFAVLCFTFWLMGIFFFWQTTGGRSTKAPPQELQAVFESLVGNFGLSNIKLSMVKTSRINGMLLFGECFVSENSVETLSPAGLEFLVAHELAHAKIFSYRPKPLATHKWPQWLLCSFGLIGLVSLRLQLPWFYYIFTIAPIAILVIFLSIKFPTSQSSMGPDMELACDYLAINNISDPKGGLEFFEVAKHGTKVDRALSGHPPKEKRVEQIESFLEGKPRMPYKNAYVEQAVKTLLAQPSSV